MITYEYLLKKGYHSTSKNPYLYLQEFVNPTPDKFPDINKWVYDVEDYKDFFSVTFIPADTSKQLIKKYCRADMTHNIRALVKTMRNMNVVIFTIREGDGCESLKEFLITKAIYRIGFNNIGYDDPMLSILVKTNDEVAKSGYIPKLNILSKRSDKYIMKSLNTILYELSNKIVNDGLTWEELKALTFRGIQLDILKLHRLRELGVNLKKVAVILMWYRIQDLPYVPGLQLNTPKAIEEGRIFNTLTYNINDVLITLVAFKKSRNEFKMRAGISKTLGVNVHTLSRSATGDKILESKYSEISGKPVWKFNKLRTVRKAVPFVDIIDESITFETETFKKLYDKLMRTTTYVKGHPKYKEFKYELIFDGTKYKMALGGLHSVDRPMYLESTDKYDYIDADVSSYYPNIMLNLFICPKHLDPNIFLAVIDIMLHDRIEAKKLQRDKSLTLDAIIKYKFINEGLKISINNLYGKLGYQHGWLYDLRAMYKTTINGQLMLFKLIEMLYLEGISTVSANTDGIICKVPKGKKDTYLKVCRKWEKLFNFDLEFTNYSKYLATSVNHYIAIKDTGALKKKGEFVKELSFEKGYKAPIVPIVLEQWFLNNVDIKEAIRSNKNPFNFMYSQKVGNNMELFVLTVNPVTGKVEEEKLQKTDRYYVTTNGQVLIKRYHPTHKNYTLRGNVRNFNLKKGQYVNIVNDIDYNHKLTNINYGYYIKEVNRILDRAFHLDHKLITGTKSKSGISGNLFENYE